MYTIQNVARWYVTTLLISLFHHLPLFTMRVYAQKHSRVVLTAEVETLLEDTIEEHVDAPQRAGVLSRLVEKLESDPAWVATYTVTGELHVPGVGKAEEEEEGMGAVLEVRMLTVYSTF